MDHRLELGGRRIGAGLLDESQENTSAGMMEATWMSLDETWMAPCARLKGRKLLGRIEV
jgi:hypothetical protein